MKVKVEALGSVLMVVGSLSTSFFSLRLARNNLPLLGGFPGSLASGPCFDGGIGSFGGRELTQVSIRSDVSLLINLSYFSCRGAPGQ